MADVARLANQLAHAIRQGRDVTHLVDPLILSKSSRVIVWFDHLLKLDLSATRKSDQNRELLRHVMAVDEREDDSRRETLLELAIRLEHREAVLALLKLDCDGEVWTRVNCLGDTIWHTCAWYKSRGVLRDLVKLQPRLAYESLEIRNAFQLTPLQVTVVSYSNPHEARMPEIWRYMFQTIAPSDTRVGLRRPPVDVQLLSPLLRAALLFGSTARVAALWHAALDIYGAHLLEKSISLDSVGDASMLGVAVLLGNVAMIREAVAAMSIDHDTETLMMHVCRALDMAHIVAMETKNELSSVMVRKIPACLSMLAVTAACASERLVTQTGFCEALLRHTAPNNWTALLLRPVVMSGHAQLASRLVSLGVHCDGKPGKWTRALSQDIWEDDTLDAVTKRRAIAILFRAGSNWLPERYHDPQNFFKRLLSRFCAPPTWHEFGKNPRHLWCKFARDYDVILEPTDERWRQKERAVVDSLMLSLDSPSGKTAKPPSVTRMKGACMVCSEEVPKKCQLCGPGGCSCALCIECLGAYATNCHQSFGNDIVRCPTLSCKRLLHPTFLAQLVQQQLLSEEQYLTICRRQVRNLRVAQEPSWRFCSDACVGGKAIGVDAPSSFMSCDFCYKTGCYKCGEQHSRCGDSANVSDAAAATQALLLEGCKPGGRVRRCPFTDCRVMMHLDLGCNAVTCVACKREWHWNYGRPDQVPTAMRVQWTPYMIKYNCTVPHDSDDMSCQYE